MKTLTELTEQTGVEVYDHVADDLEIPVLDGLQAQGDLIVVPLDNPLFAGHDIDVDATGLAVPSNGIELVRGQHPHLLVADPGTATYTRIETFTDRLAVGIVEATAPVWLLHPEHGATGIAPGRYLVRRQREQAAEQRLVAD